MKHEIRVLNKDIPEGEPLFLLRGHDPQSPGTIERYADELETRATLSSDPDKQIQLRGQAVEAREVALDMRRWQHIQQRPNQRSRLVAEPWEPDCPAMQSAVWEADPVGGVCPLCGGPAQNHPAEGDPLSADWEGATDGPE